MHYYLGLEVWKKCGEVFLGQGKYAMNILQKFGMMDCKSMDTPMTKNIRKVRDLDSNPVDPSLLLEYWMCSFNHRKYSNIVTQP
jgi:hypothetical protein